MSYEHKKIDQKWQQRWEKEEPFKAVDFSEKPKYFALDMFPYPSGAGLHVGHMASYTPTDVVSRYKRQKGFNVLHPIGYDAFGLPAEQYAIQTGIHPEVTTQKSIETFRRQLKSFGFSFDWSREISTCSPDYYKWTQFIFKKLFDKGLAYQKEAPVNWCPALKTVLANEEVVDGKSERGGHPVVRKPMKQWMLKITEYADVLQKDLDLIDWPERTKEGQRNWIGKSMGAFVDFTVKGSKHSFKIYTTRPDTLFGATFMVLSPEHPLVGELTTAAEKNQVDAYVASAASKSEVDRKANTEKTGVPTGSLAINPISGQEVPIWIADYVLMDYGTGAIMAVPAHDARDFEFATKYKLPIVRVLESSDELPYEGDGILINSGFLNGLKKDQAIEKAIEHLEAKGLGEKTYQYKIRDWLFSRQRYWGEPFPIVHMADGPQSVPVEELPVILPQVPNYEPSEDGQAPLSRNQDWVEYTSKDGKKGRRETDTMPGTAGSCWYFLRYTDPKNENSFADFEKQKYWMPVDLYVGGPEHTVSHLLYSRFWHKVLFQEGLVSHPEPVKKLAHQGMILGPDGEKMSKSRGNVINPDVVRDEYGADALRCFILFLGPMDRDKPWSPSGIVGVKKFLERVWRLCISEDGQFVGDDSEIPVELEKVLHKTIKKVGEDIESLSFNTCISALMILVNETYQHKCQSRKLLKPLVSLLAPFAPHICEEIWEAMGEKSFSSLSPWPEYNPKLTVDDTVSIGIQVDGKRRGAMDLAKDATEDQAMQKALAIDAVKAAIGEKGVGKVIYVPGKILNIIGKR
ncbi:MAG: leucine--tRNA ligase [Bdellovibrionales bacterium]|nr:leucine--tRNA ligase [Bdellovibrionales bacterium]